MFTDSIEFVSLEDLRDNLEGLDPLNTLILCDSNTKLHCLALLNLDHFKQIVLPAGEASKSLESCQVIWDKMLQMGMDRDGIIVNIGGGVITDLGAFCASVYKRGCSFIHVPTSLMAMVDASIGGKTAIDYGSIKNPIGTFADADEILIYPGFLQTLPQDEWINGFAECIKHALIQSSELWEEIIAMSSFDKNYIQDNLERFLQVKLDIVEEDPFELSNRKLLNFGHTLGHALEAHFLENNIPIKHGEAIVFGMVCESHLAVSQGQIKESTLGEIIALFKRYYPKINWESKHEDLLLDKIKNDKKSRLGRANYTLIKGIGEGIIDQHVEIETVLASIQYYKTNY